MLKSAVSYQKSGKCVRLNAVPISILLFLLLAVAPSEALAQVAPAREPEAGSGKIERRADRTLIDETIPADKALLGIIESYSARVRALEQVIGKLKGELRKSGLGGGTLGNFVADGLRTQAHARIGRPVVLAVINSGGLRKNTIAEGELRASDIFELLPFENELVQIDLTGQQVLRLLAVVVANREPQSGARLTYRRNNENRAELVSAKLLVNGREEKIDPKKLYSILTIDYLVQLASGRYSILQQGKNLRPLGLTTRDAMINYVKSETAAGRAIQAKLDGRFVSVDAEASDREEQ